MTAALVGVLLVVLCTMIEGFAQIFLKKSSAVCDRRRLWAVIGIALFVIEALVYTVALQFLDVSTAYPIGSLSFVAVTVLSRWMLGETVTRTRWVGVGLIIVGAGLVVAHV
ncbi:EamA family transporter [Telmatospirillum sp.]|uniref:DMT family transporter n=1 Tax=Telmatospirillum sp. TaxID=2079197 RepID=UPI00283CF1AF|nr:EamA family transporter [Telmatospirillum sp.]MDR3440113.1 SMR family transporter [Telmatospirillum sp.]